MFTTFFLELRQGGVPVSLTEYLTLMEAMGRGLAAFRVEEFYYLSRACLVKDERHIDRFDQVFARVFKGLTGPDGEADEIPVVELPEEWLKALAERFLTEEEMRRIQALGGWEKLMETLARRLEEQKGRHEGGSKWIGTAGTSPFGANGYNPEGVRIGEHKSRHRRAVKVWDRREFRNFDDTVEIGTRNIKLALRRLRKFARTGAADELDLPGTIAATASNAGCLDLKMRPERRNAVKVLLFLDVGGSMDDHVTLCDELFSAARAEFKHLEHYYFHNCVYEGVWRDNRRRHDQRVPTWDVINTYGADYKLIFVGDAAMSPYEIVHQGGSVEHWNAESGQMWLGRLLARFPRAAWLNPTDPRTWGYTESTRIVSRLMGGRMHPLTLEGLDRAMRELTG